MPVQVEGINEVEVQDGMLTYTTYRHTSNIIGKTVEGIGLGWVNGAFGPESCSVIFFNDGTAHGYVHS